MLIPLDLKL